MKYVRTMFDIFDVPMVSVNPSDSYQSLCQCEKYEGKSDPDRSYPGRLSNYVWGYVNRVAKEVYKTHPDRKILGMSYNTYRLPPDRFAKLVRRNRAETEPQSDKR